MIPTIRAGALVWSRLPKSHEYCIVQLSTFALLLHLPVRSIEAHMPKAFFAFVVASLLLNEISEAPEMER